MPIRTEAPYRVIAIGFRNEPIKRLKIQHWNHNHNMCELRKKQIVKAIQQVPILWASCQWLSFILFYFTEISVIQYSKCRYCRHCRYLHHPKLVAYFEISLLWIVYFVLADDRHLPFHKINRFHLVIIKEKSKVWTRKFQCWCNFIDHKKTYFINIGEIQCNILHLNG